MKIIKLLLIAMVLIGSVYGIIELLDSSGDPTTSTINITSAQAKMWKQKIDDLCNDNHWSSEKYKDIANGIHADRATSKGDLISLDEELSLKKYLYATSCSYIKEGADKLFKQNSYPDKDIKTYSDAIEFLKEEKVEQGENSNLAETIQLYASYHRLLNLLTFGAQAHYSHPLKAYNGGNYSGRKSTIQGLPYYKSHFSNNSKIRNKVSGIEEDMKRAEQSYYSNLEKCIENNYKNHGDIALLLEDQIQFERISTNTTATARLDNFIRTLN